MDEFLASSGTCIEQFILASLLWGITEIKFYFWDQGERDEPSSWLLYTVRNLNNSFFDFCNRNSDILSLSLCILCNTLNNFKLYK